MPDPLTQPASLVLASNSPRRRQLLAFGGWAFRVQPADVDETPLAGEPPLRYVRRLAEAKARAAAALAPGEIIVASDTTVADGDQILGKPASTDDARRMLRQLRGRTHQVFTGIAILAGATLASDVCETDVPMRSYTDAEIEAYIATGDPLDKAGAYAIQHPVFRPVERLSGCYASVMGLPVCHLTRLLRSLDIHPQADVPQACQAALAYACPVYTEILS